MLIRLNMLPYLCIYAWMVITMNSASLQIRVCNQELIFLFLNETYVVGTQKNRLHETVLLSTQNKCSN